MRTRTSIRTATIAALAATAAGLLASSPAIAQEKPTISVTSIDLVNDTVEITNVGDADVDVNGLILCNFPAYAPIEGAEMIAPGESITVDAGAAGVELADDQGEMGIYTVSEFENPDAILTYVEWGTSGHQRSTVAVSAGIWDGDAVDAGSVLTANVAEPTSAANWSAEGDTATAADDLPATGAESWALALAALGLLALAAGTGAWGRIERRKIVA